MTPGNLINVQTTIMITIRVFIRNFRSITFSWVSKMKLTLSCFIVVFLCLVAFAEKARYDNYRVYHVAIENDVQLKALIELSEVSDSVSSKSETLLIRKIIL